MVDADLIDMWQKGITPNFSIFSNLTDPNTGKSEKYMVTGVQFTEITPADWEAKTVVKRSMPFTFTGIKVLTKIE